MFGAAKAVLDMANGKRKSREDELAAQRLQQECRPIIDELEEAKVRANYAF